MKVFNLTDVETPKLRQFHLVAHTIAVGRALIAPGESADVSMDEFKWVRTEVQRLVTLGALAIDSLPAAYTLAKQNKVPPHGDRPSTPPHWQKFRSEE
jgi:hypothetical protein